MKVLRGVPSFLMLLALGACGAEKTAPGVTRQAIRAVRLGMPESEVTAILGAPLSTKLDQTRGVKTLEYARPVRGARWYPMLWVHLREDRVVEVYAKKYVWWGADDEGVYGLSNSGQWEARGFEASFRK